jgi:hypothetical protein
MTSFRGQYETKKTSAEGGDDFSFSPVEDIGHDVADVTEGPAAVGGGDLLLPRQDCGT